MNICEAITRLLEEKARGIRRPYMIKQDRFIITGPESEIMWDDGGLVHFSLSSFTADDWELVWDTPKVFQKQEEKI